MITTTFYTLEMDHHLDFSELGVEPFWPRPIAQAGPTSTVSYHHQQYSQVPNTPEQVDGPVCTRAGIAAIVIYSAQLVAVQLFLARPWMGGVPIGPLQGSTERAYDKFPVPPGCENDLRRA